LGKRRSRWAVVIAVVALLGLVAPLAPAHASDGLGDSAGSWLMSAVEGVLAFFGWVPGESGSNLTGESGSNLTGESGSNLTGESGSNLTGESGSN